MDMFRQRLGIAIGCQILLVSAHAQTAGDCWAVRFGSIERKTYESYEYAVIGFIPDGRDNTYEVRYINWQTPSLGFACAKFDSNGNKLWERSYTATNGAVVLTPQVAIDASGSLIVLTGLSPDFEGQNVEVVVMRFDPDGTRAWLSRFNSRGFQHRLVVDAAGNTFVTGVNFGASVNATSIDLKSSPIALTKLDTNGNGIWCSKTNSIGPYEPTPPVLAIGPQGDLHAAWSTMDNYNRAFVTVRLTPEGLERWRRQYVWFNLYQPYSLLIDSEGNVFTTGSIFWGTPQDTHLTVKYSADGTELWVANWPDDSERGEIGATGLDDSGNFYIALGLARWRGRALVTAKFDIEGNRVWTIYEDAPAEDHYWNLSLRIDWTQAVLVSGLFSSTNEYARATIRYLQNTTPGLPVIRRQPISGRVRAGSTVTLEVLVTGLQPLFYQWRLDGNDMAAETNAALVLSNIATHQSASYSLLVTNPAGCALSSDIRLTVIEIPPFRLSTPTVTQIVFQETDGSWGTNQLVEMLLTGGKPDWYYTVELSTNSVQWQPYLSKGVEADGSALFSVRLANRGARFFRASTWP